MDLVSQTLRPRVRGRPLFAKLCTIVPESGLKPPFESPILDFPDSLQAHQGHPKELRVHPIDLATAGATKEKQEMGNIVETVQPKHLLVIMTDAISNVLKGKGKGIPGESFIANSEVFSTTITDQPFIFALRAPNSNYRCSIVLPEDLISITDTDVWKYSQKILHSRYRLSLEFKSTSTDFRRETNE